MQDLPGHWVANEAPRVLEGLVTPPTRPAPGPGQFLLALDGVRRRGPTRLAAAFSGSISDMLGPPCLT